MTTQSRHITIMAGGTGGHIMPGLAVARQLLSLDQQVSWIGSNNSMEQRLVPEHGVEFHALDIRGLRGAGWGRKLRMPWQLSRAIWQALRTLKGLHPDCVLSMGGFAAAPGGIAAWLLRVPLVVHEQNRIPGLTNRLLARIADQVCQAFADSFPTRQQALVTGNPVRADIVALRRQQRASDGQQQSSSESAALRVLVLGGSQGANALNRQLPRLLATSAAAAGCTLNIRHQCGERWQQVATQAYAEQTGRFEKLDVTPYISDMAAAYAWADLVIARAGAMTISELAAAGCASVLVPFPFAVDDHQTANAQVLVNAGGAMLMPEDQLTEASSQAMLTQLLSTPATLQQMATAAAAMHAEDASSKLASICLEQCR
jgi:UDP-N-acetylglucosamine--N-acetylmuramyl-(pentapeptide) pyrophosphoryl-undecaprenol N-acetylglucosamine transferase